MALRTRSPTFRVRTRFSWLLLALTGCAYVIEEPGSDAGASGGNPSVPSGGALVTTGGTLGNPSGGTTSDGGAPGAGGGTAAGGRRFGMGGRTNAGGSSANGGGAGTGGRTGAGGGATDPACNCNRTWVAAMNITPALMPGDCMGYMSMLYKYQPEQPGQTLTYAAPNCAPPVSSSDSCKSYAKLVLQGPCP